MAVLEVTNESNNDWIVELWYGRENAEWESAAFLIDTTLETAAVSTNSPSPSAIPTDWFYQRNSTTEARRRVVLRMYILWIYLFRIEKALSIPCVFDQTGVLPGAGMGKAIMDR
jgi:hypothetical protein